MRALTREQAGRRVKAAREAKGLTQKELSARLVAKGLQAAQSTLSYIETGVYPITDSLLKPLARELGIGEHELLVGWPDDEAGSEARDESAEG